MENSNRISLEYWQARFASTLLMSAGLAIGLWVFILPVTGIDFSHFPGDLGDGRLNMFFLEHIYRYLIGDVPSFWDAPYMYPEPNFLAYSDNLIGSSPFYLIFRSLGFDTYASYLGWFVFVHSLNYVAAFYFLQYVTKDARAALIGAFVFAFSIALQSQMVHAQTFPRFAIPLAFWMAFRFAETRSPKYFFATLGFVVYQIYCGVYLGFMLAVPVAIFLGLLAVQLIVQKSECLRSRDWYLKIVSSVLVNLSFAFLLMLPYMKRKIQPSSDHFERIIGGLPTWKSHLYSQKGSLFWDFASEFGRDLPHWWNHQIFAGGVATISFVLVIVLAIRKGLVQPRKLITARPFWLMILSGAITMLLFLRWGDFTFYKLLYAFPGFSSMRALARIVNVELLFFASATAFLAHQIFIRTKGYSNMLFVVLFTVVIADNYYKTDYIDRTKVKLGVARTAPLDEVYASIPKGAVVSYEPLQKDTVSYLYQIDAMLLAQKYGLYTVNAYTATCPAEYNQFWSRMDSVSRNYWLKLRWVEHERLYVVRGKGLLEQVELRDFPSRDEVRMLNRRVVIMMDYIRQDSSWMKLIQKKALRDSISIDSALYRDAIWLLER